MSQNNSNRNAARAAATTGKVTFTHKGKTYTIESAEHWDVDVLLLFEQGKVISAVNAVLGDRQWDVMKSTGRKAADVGEMMEAIAKATGMQGN
ncbi:hypothetical protein HPO96_36990 [Kribbella sandramycini]|uniref:Uncharacterized protein n=1 Tax=Kribbella sandramycini TaxID=60450 RepID=A0A7Y4L9T3_9ACTN|nr:hypothetical protein [Kribbella sandramycini]MBB6564393.1 hypothetical protein [Kribbella sandramycini]NOL45856.1 hypothetical protein [Kribbella sandramycini]